MTIATHWSKIRAWSGLAPLFAAIIAPLSTLLDVPALAQNWFNDELKHSIKDPRSSIALSAAGLAFNILANLLLLVRFSSTTSETVWRWSTRFSVLCWWTKVALALANISIFGLPRPGTIRAEGFWCAVVSLVICGMICTLLSFHWAIQFAPGDEDEHEARVAVRISGRHFMLQVTFFVLNVCLFALVTSRIEGWTYFQGIYFGIITFLTIGFGDYHPTKTVTRVLICPFAIIGVAQLACLVSMIVSFFAQRVADRRAENRFEFQLRRQEQLEEMDRDFSDHTPDGTMMMRRPDLGKEFDYLDRLRKNEDKKDQRREVVLSLGGLLVFWIVGAAIFSHLEGWGYGISLYVNFVVFLTIGYGDYAPVTPGGRVIFVIYALVAVPVMASFAVQTVVHIFTTISEKRLLRRRAKQAKHVASSAAHTHTEPDEEKCMPTSQGPGPGSGRGGNRKRRRKFTPHSEFVARFHSKWDEEAAVEEEDAQLTERVIALALAVERRSRKLLITHLGSGSTAKMLLQADRNVQLREMRTIRRRGTLTQEEQGDAVGSSEGAGVVRRVLEEDHDAMRSVPPASMSDEETLEEVERYREDFAGLLAAGSRLMKLKGEERALFEKRWEALEEVKGADLEEEA